MTPEERAAKIARLQKIDQLEEMDRQTDPAQPGVEAIGSPDGTTPDASLTQQALHGGGVALGATTKVMDLPRAMTGPVFAQALEALTGKQAASWNEWEDAVNPTNLKTFPSADKMYERVGVKPGAKVSDFVDGYAKPGKDVPWYQPEIGGMLDPTVRGTGGFATDTAIDPLTYMSFGASSAAKKAVAEGAAKQVAMESAGPLGKAAQAVDRGVEKITQPIANMAARAKSVPFAGPILSKMASAPSDALDWLGKKMYTSTLLPIEHEGEKFGKQAVGETMFDMGITNPLNLSEKTQGAADKLMAARNKILADAGAAGGKVDMNVALERAKETVSKIRAEGRPKQQWIADQLEKEIAEHEAMVQGKEGIPAIGQPSVPGREISPEMGSQLKSDLYKETPDAAWNLLKKTPEGAAVTTPLSKGMNEATLRAVEEASGAEAAKKVADLNAEAGKLLSTQNATRNVEKQADRLAHNTVSPSGTSKVLMSLGGPGAALMNMAGDAVRLGTMPTGYGIRKLAEGRLTGPMIDNYIRRKITNGFNQGDDNGQR